MADMIEIAFSITPRSPDERPRPLKQVSGRQAIDQALLNLKTLIDEATIVTFGRCPKFLKADESQLATMFQHLIENADGSSQPDIPPGGPPSPPDSWRPSVLNFVVVDNGISMADRCFESVRGVQRLRSR